jgi:hypothetical protein
LPLWQSTGDGSRPRGLIGRNAMTDLALVDIFDEFALMIAIENFLKRALIKTGT